MDVAPIGADADHATALAQIDRLWGGDPASPEGRRLEILLTLADAYEEAHHAMPPSDPVSAVLSMMEQRGLTRRDLELMIGSRARLSEVQHRQRVDSADDPSSLKAENSNALLYRAGRRGRI
jgi:HTH-type transcriptional regulator/antitoxin HigA